MSRWQGDMADTRMKQFKNKARDAVELRRRRNEAVVELRKSKRTEALSKRRRVDGDVGEDDMGTGKEEPGSHLVDLEARKCLSSELPNLQSSDPNVILRAVQQVRQVLSRGYEVDSASQELIRLNMLPLLVQLLASAATVENVYKEQLQKEVAWCLTNVSSGTSEQTVAVVECGAVPYLVDLLSSETFEVREQALWALGNIAGEGADFRDFIVGQGIIERLAEGIVYFKSHDEPTRSFATRRQKYLQLAGWILCNVCRFNDPSPRLEVVQQVLPMLIDLLVTCSEQAITKEVFWAFSYLTDGIPAADGVDPLKSLAIQAGVLPYVAEILLTKTSPERLVVPSIRVIGNLAGGTTEQTQAVINAGILPSFHYLLKDLNPHVVKETAWALSNLLSGNMTQIKAIVDAGLIPVLMELFASGSQVYSRNTAWAICNFAMSGVPDYIPYFVQVGGIPTLCAMLRMPDNEVIDVALMAIHAVLRGSGEHFEELALSFEEQGGCDSLDTLQQHDNDRIADRAGEVVEEFFSEKQPMVDLIAPATVDGQFQFGLTN